MVNKVSNQFALDVQSLDKLRLEARNDPQRALKAAASQFEALFLNMVMQSMREASFGDEMTGSEETKMFTGLLDHQLSQKLSARGMGLADLMVRQLSRGQVKPAEKQESDSAPAAGESAGAAPRPAPAPLGTSGAGAAAPVPAAPSAAAGSPRAFVDAVWPHAAEAAQRLGLPPHFLVGHAALETGWGRRSIVGADGTPSHNVFGIKAGADWHGATVSAETTEYVNGVPEKRTERFRAYPSYAEAFRDYAQLLGGKRYAQAAAAGGDAGLFASALQQAGYATDPMYGDKLARILTGRTLRSALQG